MDQELQQRILQKQATSIGNLMFQNQHLEAEKEILQDRVAQLEASLRAAEESDNTAVEAGE